MTAPPLIPGMILHTLNNTIAIALTNRGPSVQEAWWLTGGMIVLALPAAFLLQKAFAVTAPATAPAQSPGSATPG